jgi:hypothetical protein
LGHEAAGVGNRADAKYLWFLQRVQPHVGIAERLQGLFDLPLHVQHALTGLGLGIRYTNLVA